MVEKAVNSFLLLLLCQVTQTSVMVQVRFVNYENPMGLANKTSGYGCCDVTLDTNSGSFNCSLADVCDTYFDVCVGLPVYSGKQRIQCAPGLNTTQVFTDANSLNFLSDPAIPDIVFNFTLNTWQGEIGLAVGVTDYDASSSDNELIKYFVNTSFPLNPEPFTAGASGSNPVLLVFQDWPANLSVEVKAWCSEEYYGANCSTVCRDSNDLHNGYYTCSPDGKKVCRPGYTGVDCRSPARTMCDRHPCLNGGTCGHGTPVSYMCRCPPLFTGKNCEIGMATSSAPASHKQGTQTGVFPLPTGPGVVPSSLQPRLSTSPVTTQHAAASYTTRQSLNSTSSMRNSTTADISKAIIIGSTLGGVLLLAALLTLAILCCCCCNGCCARGTGKVRPAQ